MRRCHSSAGGEHFWLKALRALVCGYKSLVLRLVQQGLGHKGFRRSQLWFPSRKRLGFRHGDQFLLRAHGELRPLHGPCGRYGYG